MPEVKGAFAKLKKAFTEASILRHFNLKKRIVIETDASGFIISRIISQLQEDNGQWHPITFWSHKITNAECCYKVHNKELLAIIKAFWHWRHYLEESRHTIVVWSDHANLCRFMELRMKRLNLYQTRWAEALAVFDFVIKHQSGAKNPADTPSCRPNYKPSEGELLEGTLLPTLQNKLFWGLVRPKEWAKSPSAESEPSVAVRVVQTAVQNKNMMDINKEGTHGMDWNTLMDENHDKGNTGILGPLVPWASVRDNIRPETAYSELAESMTSFILCMQNKDPKMKKFKTEVQARTLRVSSDLTWEVDEHDLLRFIGWVYIPRVPAVKDEILKVNHNNPSRGHLGFQHTLESIHHKYFWHGMHGDVKQYVKTCDMCQQIKVHRHTPYRELQPLPAVSKPRVTHVPRFHNRITTE